jgi:hypothetical protein
MTIPLDKTCQDGSVPIIGTKMKAEKKKVEELKDNVITVVLSPHSSLIPSINTTLLLPCSPKIQVVELGDGRSDKRESIEFDKATKKTIEIEKGPEGLKLIS